MTIYHQNGITSLTKFKYSVLPRKLISHYGSGFLILSISFSISISSILFCKNQPNLSKVMRFETLGSTLLDFPFISVASHVKRHWTQERMR